MLAAMIGRQIGVVGPAAEGEVQHLHSRQAVGVPQRLDFRRDDAEILRHQRQPAKLGPQGSEQLVARRQAPASRHGGLGAGRNFPIRFQSPEMIDAQQVELGQLGADALLPPLEPVGPHLLPSVVRIAPQLAGGREIVGRHAGDHLRPSLVVQQETVAPRPDVGAVVADEERNVAENQNAPLVRVLF
jgi:hypothetical protein